MFKTLFVTAGMLAVGWLVWTLLQRQESSENGDASDGDERNDKPETTDDMT